MANVSAVFSALHDPTRRHVMDVLRDGPHSVREITDTTAISQSAISQHLKVLRGADLVTSEKQGTRRLYSINPDGLGDARAWLDSFWDDTLDAFVNYAESNPLS